MYLYHYALDDAHFDARMQRAQNALRDVADSLSTLCYDLEDAAGDVPDEDADALRNLRDMIEAVRDDVRDARSDLRLVLESR